MCFDSYKVYMKIQEVMMKQLGCLTWDQVTKEYQLTPSYKALSEYFISFKDWVSISLLICIWELYYISLSLSLTLLILSPLRIRNHVEARNLAHPERDRKEKDCRITKAYDVDDDETFKNISHKKDITCYLYNNVYCANVANMKEKLPRKDYTLLIADIPYGFRMVGSSN